MPLRDGFFSTATQTSCCNRIQRSNRVRLLVVSTHDFPDNRYAIAPRDDKIGTGLVTNDGRDGHRSGKWVEFCE